MVAGSPQDIENGRVAAEDVPPFSSPFLAGRKRSGRGKRSARVERAVQAGILRWRKRSFPSRGTVPVTGILPAGSNGDVKAPIPRKKWLDVKDEADVRPKQREDEVFRVGAFKTSFRLLVWLFAAARFLGGTFWDWVRRRYSPQHQAERLRLTLQSMGMTFIKFGQQLSMRIDLIPYIYAVELEKLLDDVPPFPVEEAIKEIEQATAKPLAETFAVFDPEPIGSASIACVYLAVLHNGNKVAVKVRRPGIGERLAADMRALGWMLQVMELFVMPPGFTKNFLYELRTMLMDELDFVKEGRSTEIFRRSTRKAKLHYVTAPRIYPALSGRRVLTAKFIDGISLPEILGAVEHHDEAALTTLHELNINPKIIARRLIRVNRFGGFEALFFHADLHPANVIVRPHNKLVLIDFGACGTFTNQERRVWRRLLYAQSKEDVGSMVRAAVGLLEPLPAIDIDELKQKLTPIFWEDLYAFNSKHSDWWERTSANIWIGFLRLAREYQIPMNLNTLRMIRVSVLADMIAACLYNKVDHYREYRKFEKGAGKRAHKRLLKDVRRNFSYRTFIDLEQVFNAVPDIVFHVQRLLDFSPWRFTALVDKWSYGISLLLKTLSGLCVATGTSVLAVAAYMKFFEKKSGIDLLHILLHDVLSNGWYQAFIILMLVITGRRPLHRLSSKDA